MTNKQVKNNAAECVDEKRLLDLFLELAKIDGPSGKEQKVADYLVKALPELGFTFEFDEAHKEFGGQVGNLIAYKEGTDSSVAPVFFSTHMDTVLSTKDLKPVIKDGVIYSDGTTILGADDRAALAAYLEGVRAVIESGIPHGPIELVLTVNEQPGLVGARHLDYSKPKSKFGYIFDSSGNVGQTILKGPYSSRIWMKVKGNAAHIALNSEEGNNAFILAAAGLLKLNLGEIDDETLANIGVIEGGELTSIIPGEVTVAGEVRSFSKDKLDKQLQHMEDAMRKAVEDRGGSVDVKIEKKYSGFAIPEDHILTKTVLDASANISVDPYLTQTLGGADTNVLNENGLTCLTLGNGFQNIHSFRECISIENLTNTGKLTAALIQKWYESQK
ncbi:peptidase M20 [Sporosarcina sp. P21c]|uniref:M20/M25/M40 family metallo-hydrolase n=1 Tax=unclassified Sporosarcina TaxID=2647733 RepID=UPI000C168626|nr:MULTISPECIES: M20/M25/M40 family metallo-hydrolase [unclassified Sporosarcina]PIC66126.1 peptidase M20 [Sporosarcina sp. P16a]PIC88657.1 peptidase M20 [Sporosarcina sp. P21c]PIC91728.1 peptidase M20 [Sporosarcina sp. P25]